MRRDEGMAELLDGVLTAEVAADRCFLDASVFTRITGICNSIDPAEHH